MPPQMISGTEPSSENHLVRCWVMGCLFSEALACPPSGLNYPQILGMLAALAEGSGCGVAVGSDTRGFRTGPVSHWLCQPLTLPKPQRGFLF